MEKTRLRESLLPQVHPDKRHKLWLKLCLPSAKEQTRRGESCWVCSLRLQRLLWITVDFLIWLCKYVYQRPLISVLQKCQLNPEKRMYPKCTFQFFLEYILHYNINQSKFNVLQCFATTMNRWSHFNNGNLCLICSIESMESFLV